MVANMSSNSFHPVFHRVSIVKPPSVRLPSLLRGESLGRRGQAVRGEVDARAAVIMGEVSCAPAQAQQNAS
jgi:hypothetical protein